MSLYFHQVCRLDGDLRVFCKIQNDYTGAITESIRQIFSDNEGKKYFRVDGRVKYIDNDIADLLRYEHAVEYGIKLARANNLI